MFNVGIKNNVVIEKAEINEKGTLVISMKEIVETDIMDVFNSTSDAVVRASENSFMEYNQLNTVKFGNEQTAEEVLDQIKNFKAKLMHILLVYKTEDKIKIDSVKGTGINGTNAKTKVLDQSILDLIYKNTVEGFVKELTTVDLSKQFHLKTVRQSAAKHFAKLPDSKFGYTGQNAFIQDAALPCTLKYSKYEVDKGLNNPNPVVADQTASDEDIADQKAAVDDVFGG